MYYHRRIVDQEGDNIWYQYLIKWENMTHDFDTWEPGNRLKNSEQLLECISHTSDTRDNIFAEINQNLVHAPVIIPPLYNMPKPLPEPSSNTVLPSPYHPVTKQPSSINSDKPGHRRQYSATAFKENICKNITSQYFSSTVDKHAQVSMEGKIPSFIRSKEYNISSPSESSEILTVRKPFNANYRQFWKDSNYSQSTSQSNDNITLAKKNYSKSYQDFSSLSIDTVYENQDCLNLFTRNSTYNTSSSLVGDSSIGSQNDLCEEKQPDFQSNLNHVNRKSLNPVFFRDEPIKENTTTKPQRSLSSRRVNSLSHISPSQEKNSSSRNGYVQKDHVIPLAVAYPRCGSKNSNGDEIKDRTHSNPGLLKPGGYLDIHRIDGGQSIKKSKSSSSKLQEVKSKKLDTSEYDSVSSVDNLIVFVGSLSDESPPRSGCKESDIKISSETKTIFKSPPNIYDQPLPPLPKTVNSKLPVQTMELNDPSNLSNRSKQIRRIQTTKDRLSSNKLEIRNTFPAKLSHSLHLDHPNTIAKIFSSSTSSNDFKKRTAILRISSTDGKTTGKVNHGRKLSRSLSSEAAKQRQSCVLYRSKSISESNSMDSEYRQVPITPTIRWRLAQDKLNQRNGADRKRRLSG